MSVPVSSIVMLLGGRTLTLPQLADQSGASVTDLWPVVQAAMDTDRIESVDVGGGEYVCPAFRLSRSERERSLVLLVRESEQMGLYSWQRRSKR